MAIPGKTDNFYSEERNEDFEVYVQRVLQYFYPSARKGSRGRNQFS